MDMWAGAVPSLLMISAMRECTDVLAVTNALAQALAQHLLADGSNRNFRTLAGHRW